MKHIYFIIALLIAPMAIYAQQYNLEGMLADTTGKPVANAAVSLLLPGDSTLAFFGISGSSGHFEVKAVKGGNYVLQVASMGFNTFYRQETVPLKDGQNLGYIILRRQQMQLDEVAVHSERIPMLLKGDTVEYNASSYKVKPDATTEDLLKKMPGIQIDKAGNIKAQGKQVQKVLVDGKEFFGDDPKMATKNLPADAISKVQVFDKKSDQSLFSGIDDGDREQTINLELKGNKRKGYFGDIEAGGGTGDHFKGSAHLYHFQPKSQFAALGMVNNINQFGFTLQDYLSFQGGLRGLMDGNNGGVTLGGNMPLNYGQQVDGLISSAAAGINYSIDPRPKNHFSISYLSSGANKQLDETSNSRNFTDNGTFIRNDDVHEATTDRNHGLNFNWRNELDSTQQLILRGGAGLSKSSTNRALISASQMEMILLNKLDSHIYDDGTGYNGNLYAGYQKKFMGSNWPVFKLSSEGTVQQSKTNTQWNNLTYLPTDTLPDRQYQDSYNFQSNYNARTSIIRRLGNGFYLEPSVKAGINTDHIRRNQGALPAATEVDSLSPDFQRSYSWMRPGLTFRHNTTKVQSNVAVEAEAGSLVSGLLQNADARHSFQYLLPSAFYQNSYATGRMFHVAYSSKVTAPSAREMLPVTDYSNSISRLTGNPLLAPEYSHTISAGWLRFDQFSGTSLMANLNGTYTHDKINYSRKINPDLSEDATFINVPDDYNLRGNVEYSTPIRKLGISINMELNEQYNRGLTMINEVLNANTTYNHVAKLTIRNRKQDKWDVECSLSADISDAHFSISQSQNNTFYHYNGFAQLSYKPSDRFYLSITGTVDQYNAKSFAGAVTIPLVNAAVTYYFMANKRAVLTLDGFDLLNQNTGLQRSSQYNYLLEKRSNIITRYCMLSFKYRLNKTGHARNEMQIEMKR